jgi:DNA ligase (NAD+)
LGRFIYALGIRHVGEHIAQVLARNLSSLDAISNATEEELVAIKEIGPEVAQSITRFFGDKGNKKEIKRLLKAGIKIAEPKARKEEGLKGKTFLFTGALEGLSRSDAKDLVEACGGEIASSAGKGVDYVVVGTDPGSKYAKAKELGLTIIDEEEFQRLVGRK